MTYAIQRDAFSRTRQELLVLGLRECQNSYATLVQQLLTYTEQFDNAAWTATSVTVSANAVEAPDGTTTADSITYNATSDKIGQTVTGEVVTSLSYTASVWMKIPSGTQTVTLVLRDSLTAESAIRQMTLTTTWQRFFIQYKFTGTPVGDLVFEIERRITDDVTVLYAWGANANLTPGNPGSGITDPAIRTFPYIKREAEAVGTVSVNASRCEAADAGDGARCFYSYPTCQDTDNFNAGNTYEATAALRGIREFLFCRKDAPLAISGVAITPSIISSPRASQEIDPDRAVTVNESITYDLQDDAGPGVWNLVKQQLGMLVNTASGTGTFWTRALAIYGNFSNPDCYALRKIGFVEAGATEADYQTRGKYLIRSVEIADYRARLKCADRLRLVKKSVPPQISDTNQIEEVIWAAGTTSFSVTDASEITPPAANAASASPDYVVTILFDGGSGEEKCNVTAISGNTLTLQRGRWGTTAVAGVGPVSFQEIVEFGTEDSPTSDPVLGKNPIDIVVELLTRGGIAAADIDTAQLEAERAAWLVGAEQFLDDTEVFSGASWTATSVTVTDDTNDAPDGTHTADTVVYNADNDAIAQTTSEAVTSKAFTGSIWMKKGSGTDLVTIRVRNVAGTQIGSKQVTVTSTWQRFFVHKLFTGVPVDNAVFEVIRIAGDATGSLRMWGANLHRNAGDVDAEVEYPYMNVPDVGEGPVWRRTIYEPTDIEEMLSEIRDTIQLFLFVNQSQMISGVMYEYDITSATTLTEDSHLVAGSIALDHNHDERLTRTLISWGLPDGSDPGNVSLYTKHTLSIDRAAESRGFYGGDFRQKIIRSPWIPTTDTFSAGYFTERLRMRYRDGVKTVSFRLEVKDDDLDIGDRVTVNTAQIVDEYGANLAPLCIITKKTETDGNEIEFEAVVTEEI